MDFKAALKNKITIMREGESNPEDSSIMYAIETYDKEKGTIVDGYGTASDPATADFMRKVNNIHK